MVKIPDTVRQITPVTYPALANALGEKRIEAPQYPLIIAK